MHACVRESITHFLCFCPFSIYRNVKYEKGEMEKVGKVQIAGPQCVHICVRVRLCVCKCVFVCVGVSLCMCVCVCV